MKRTKIYLSPTCRNVTDELAYTLQETDQSDQSPLKLVTVHNELIYMTNIEHL